MLTMILTKYELFLLVMLRMLGVVVFSPVLGRRNFPVPAKVGLSFFLAVTVVMPMEVTAIGAYDNAVTLIIAMMKELAVGFTIGFTATLVYSLIQISGEIIDMQMSFGMSKTYDPGSNIQMPLLANFLNIAFILMYFMTNSHLLLISIAADSVTAVPPGFAALNPQIGMYMVKIFTNVMILSLKLAFPVIAAELITETGVGIIMRAVPQINVFVVGIQLKVLVGIATMLLICPVVTWFFDIVLRDMSMYIRESVAILAG